MPVGAVITGAAGSAGIVGAILGIYPPLLDWYTQESYLYKPAKIPDLGTAVELHFRKLIGQDHYRELFGRSGLKPEYADKIFSMSEQLLSGYEYITLWRRGRLTEENLDDRLSQLHYSVVDAERLKAVTEFFPSPGDLITFAVREVYTPEIVQRFGQLDDLPPKFMEEAIKVGLPAEQAQNYWASHWLLPSVLQGYEMFHRRVIDRETLNLLLKSLDIMPFWRDALTAISYNPLTRVDVRRMHALGTLNETEVFESYLDGGYSPENAERMTEFTLAYNADETTGLTRSAVIKAFKVDLITKDEMVEYFESFDYSAVIKFWTDTAVYEKSLKEIEEVKDEFVELYQMGAIDVEELTTNLNNLDLPSFYITKVVTQAVAKVSVKLKLPSRSDLESWLKLNIIIDREYVESMRMLGYRDSDIIKYLSEITLDVDTAVRKFLGVKTYTRWLGSGIINQDTFEEITTEMGYSLEDRDRMISEVREKAIENT